MKTNWTKNDEIGQKLVSGALDDTETIGKVGADIFEISGAEKTQKFQKIQIFSGIFPVFSVELANNPWIPVPPTLGAPDLGASHLSCCFNLLHLDHLPEKRSLRYKHMRIGRIIRFL